MLYIDLDFLSTIDYWNAESIY